VTGATPSPATLADLVVQLSAIRTVLREAHFALDDSEDLSHLDEPVHAVPLDNVTRLHRALKACERFAPKDEAWEGPGPLVTRIIEHLGHYLSAPDVGRTGNLALIETMPMWTVGVVTDGERAAVSQKAESDFGGHYFAVDPEDALEWEPTHWSPLPLSIPLPSGSIER